MASDPKTKTACNRTEVIIIGNGPSGICLSFFLSGQRPYYNGMRHPNEFLHQKLTEEPSLSIIEQSLEYLSDGLEGRSPNPVSLLLDTLTHADADIGANHPSFLTWKKDDKQAVRHIVLGKTAPGGAWQKIEGDMQTVSLSRWMELPSLPFKEWFSQRHISSGKGQMSPRSGIIHYERASVSGVRDYYTDFVDKNGMSSHFHDYCTVTSVRKIYNMRTCIDSESGEVTPCCRNVKVNHQYVWEVRGYRMTDADAGESPVREEFCFLAPHVVLATGAFDIPNKLRVPGENFPYVLHTTKEYEQVIKTHQLGPDSDPVVIIGAGLTAGDMILMSMQNDIAVEHVFRRHAYDSKLIYQQLPKALYPEYHHIHGLMKGTDLLVDSDSSSYQGHAGHTVVEFTHDRKVIITHDGQEKILHCSFAIVLVGSKPDMSFMPDEGRNLGVVPKRRIHVTHNPIDVDPYTYQSVHEPGLFAVGPLVGDTFVRFVRGGALGISSYLWRKNAEEKQ